VTPKDSNTPGECPWRRQQTDEDDAEADRDRPLPAQPASISPIPRRLAASTTLASSIARVIGPVPPGIGARKPATSGDRVHIAHEPGVGAVMRRRGPRHRASRVGRDEVRDAGRGHDDVGPRTCDLVARAGQHR
jgi:hypothetical protein